LTPHGPVNPVVPFLHLTGGRATLFLVRVFVTDEWVCVARVGLNPVLVASCKYGSEVRSALLLCLENCPLETGAAIFLGTKTFVWWMTSRTPILCSMRIVLLLKWKPYVLIQ